ncbi:MAG: hypothetical protein KatS3mg115_0974 [Candidatus Poribacteria bacterium]|nr:MAG: hypothetical protein KatS3mg115_0974 [Candidatus Poribacteria bacterium]
MRLSSRALVWFWMMAALAGGGAKAELVARGELLLISPQVGYVLDAEERSRFALFPELPGFRSAQVLRTPQGLWLLAVVERANRRYLVERPLSEAEWEELRRQVRLSVRRGGSLAGRLWLVSHATAYGFAIYGVGLTDVLSSLSPREEVGTLMLSTGVAFGVSLWATGRRAVSLARARMLTAASYAGIYYGTAPELWKLRNPPDYLGQYGRMVAVPASMAAMELILGRTEPTDADATLTGWGMASGAWYGWALPHVLFSERLRDPTERRVYVSAISAAIPLGGYLAWRYSRSRGLSAGEAELTRVLTLVGAYTGLSVGRLLAGERVETDRAYVAGASVGVAGGWVLADRLAAQHEYSVGRSRLLGIAAGAGGLFGAGTLYALTNVDDERAYLAVSTATAWLTFWIVHRVTEDLGVRSDESER